MSSVGLWPDPFGTHAAEIERLVRGHLVSQRWYPAKALGEITLFWSVVPPVKVPEIEFLLTLWRVYTPASYRFVFCALAISDDAGLFRTTIGSLKSGCVLADAFNCDAFVRGWVWLIGGSMGASPGLYGQLARSQGNLDPHEQTDWQVIPILGGWSNLAFRVGNWGFLKIYTRPEPGTHPEVEVGNHLASRPPLAPVPQLIGWHEALIDGLSSPVVLSVLQRFLSSEGDAWSWLKQRLQNDEFEVALEWIRLAGRELASLHGLLSASPEDARFCAEPVSADERRQWVDAAYEQARSSFDLASKEGATPQRDKVERLRKFMPGLRQHLLKLLPESNILKARCHSDFQLCQILVTEGGKGAVVTDFEGDPLKPIEGRREKHSQLRDVASMLRSIHYCGEAVRKNGHCLPVSWLRMASSDFLGAYVAKTGTEPDRSFFCLLEFFSLEKAFYELEFELLYRPDWQDIPLAGICALLEGPANVVL